MKAKISMKANYIGWIVIILAFVFIYFSYFFIYIPQNEAQLQQKAFRILKEYGSNMIDKTNYYENHFKNYGLFYAIRALPESKSKTNIKSVHSNEDLNLINEVDSVIESLFDYVVNESIIKDSTLQIINKYENILYLSFYSQDIVDKTIKLSVEKYCKAKGKDDHFNKTFLNKVPVQKFMEGLKFDELFENIALFDTSDVYYNSQNYNLSDITNPKALCDTARKMQGGIHKIQNINGEDEHIMILPVKIKGKEFFIAGFISDSIFRQNTRNIYTQLVIYIAGILLLVFAGMPILKIIFIDSKERLKAIDAIGSGISFMFGYGLIIIIIISLLKNQIADRVINNNRINQISEILYSNINKDINSVKCLGKSIAKKNITCTTKSAQPVIAFFNDTVNKFKKVDNLYDPFKLNDIILVDNNGFVQKAYSLNPFSKLVKFNLNDRQYFQSIKDINKSWPADNGFNIYIESIKSYNTGDVETAVSFHTNHYNTLHTLAITSEIPALYNQVLPKDIEFVIINDIGKVLYHSKNDKILHENFIEECDSDPDLKNLIEKRNIQNLRLRYDEKIWLARIVPLDGTPLFHITLLDLYSAGNINARIFLFTFYFFLISFLFLLVILLILSFIDRERAEESKQMWILHWIVFQSKKINDYKALIWILFVLIVFQIFGFIITKNPVHNLIYQLVLIICILITSICILTDNKDKPLKLFQLKFLPGYIILIISFILIITLLTRIIPLNKTLILPSVFLLAAIVILIIFKHFHKPETNHENKLYESKSPGIYLAFLLLWLSALSAIPVIQFYLSFKNQENKRWQQEQILTVARKNIDLYTEFYDHNAEWFKRIQGNNIDSMKISFYPLTSISSNWQSDSISKDKVENNLSAFLPDPIRNIINESKPYKSKYYTNERFTGNKLFFEQGNKKGVISVKYAGNNFHHLPFWYYLIITLAMVCVIILLWSLLWYLSVVILNLKQEEANDLKISWSETFENTGNNKILLNSFNGSYYREQSNNLKRSGKKCNIIDITAIQLISPDFNPKSILKKSTDVIWINDFKPIVFQIQKHETFISNMNTLGQSKKLIVLDILFDVDLIGEFYDEYISANDLTPTESKKIYLLREKWKFLFENYSEYDGYAKLHNESKTDLSDENSKADNWKSINNQDLFSIIWNNLTAFEKIVLFDLADDGLMNRKNQSSVKKLITKGLIIPNPYPSLFSDDFKNFVRKNIKSTEIKAIESKLGLKGRWHNARYLILLIIVPLTVFILISQGLSIEKIFGIFAGGIAAVSGLMKLFDSNFFNQAS